MVVYHSFCAFDQSYGVPVGTTVSYDPLSDKPTLAQLPFIRAITFGGNFWVAIFFVLSGFVCSRKALRLARQKKAEEGRKAVSRSIVRRVVRLTVPATCATFLCWLSSQLGLYDFARAGHWWVSSQTPPKIRGTVDAIRVLVWECVWFLKLLLNGILMRIVSDLA